MRRISLLLVALAATAAFSAPAATTTAPQQTGRACFWASEVTSFSNAGRDRALMNIGRRETWELKLASGCPDLDWTMRIGIRVRGSERICSGRPAELVVLPASENGFQPSAGGFQRCQVREARRLSPEEAAAARGEKPES